LNWNIALGQKLKRREVHAMYGGQMQGGISTPTGSSNIFIFTDPTSGAKYGYDLHEGLREDGSYAYTGEGQVGDQSLIRGNKAIFESASANKTIRLFRTEGTFATYVGAFSLGDPDYELRQSADVNGDIRSVIVFNLIPINAALDSLPDYGGEGSKPKSQETDWSSPDWSSYTFMQAAKSEEAVTSSRVEFELQSNFGNWLLSEGHEVKILVIKIGSTAIYPDLFDKTTNTLVEAKKSSSRGHVRTAIGQVLDYKNNEKIAGNNRNCAILLPSRPAADLIELCKSLKIEIYAPTDTENLRSGFTTLT
jgi:hypothetical protein